MKRPREEGSSSSDEPSSCSDDGDAVPLPVSEAHPLGVRPWGDLLTLGEVEDEAQGAGNGQAPSKPSVRDVLRRRAAGMGSFALLPDALILTVLAEVAGSPDGASGLARLASTSTVMYAYCSNDALWRPLALAAHREQRAPSGRLRSARLQRGGGAPEPRRGRRKRGGHLLR